MSHYCDDACPKGCVGIEVRLQWKHYPNAGFWRLERVFEAHKRGEWEGEYVATFQFPVIVVRDGK